MSFISQDECRKNAVLNRNTPPADDLTARMEAYNAGYVQGLKDAAAYIKALPKAFKQEE